MDRIALLVDFDGKLTEITNTERILIYGKNKDWILVESFLTAPESDMLTAAAVRQNAKTTAQIILEQGCRHIVGKEIVGISYHTFIKAGLEVFEADDISIELLNEIYEDFMTESKAAIAEIEMIPPNPVPADDEGNYYFDFTKALRCHMELSSKKMLLPFLNNDLYYSLLIRCEHIMPWLNDYVKMHGLSMEAKRGQGSYELLITHQGCKE